MTCFIDANTTLPSSAPHVTSYGFALFPGFEVIDVFGSTEVINNIAVQYQIKLAMLAETLDLVSNRPEDPSLNTQNSTVWQYIKPTHTFANPPADLEVLIVPGGVGTFYPRNATVDFIKRAYPGLKYLMTVCSGAMLAAEAGVLDGKRATTNKATWSVATLSGAQVDWVPVARWVVDGNIWTSSGESFPFCYPFS